MLSLTDCIELSELSEEEILAIAEHEHIPEIVAAELGCELLHSEEGMQRIKSYILDCAEHARTTGHPDKADALLALHGRFDRRHPAPTH